MSVNYVNSKVNQPSTSWDVYIKEAQRQLADLKEREKGLAEVIARFRMFRDRGEPWPLDRGDLADGLPVQYPGPVQLQHATQPIAL